MAKGDSFWRGERKKAEMRKAEADGQVADSMDVRRALLRRVEAGEITLEEGQTELARIKRNAKRDGKITLAEAYREG